MAQFSLDPTLKLRPKPALIEKVGAEEPKEILCNKFLSLDHLRRLHALMKSQKEKKNECERSESLHFHELLTQCEVVLPEPKFPERSAELEARIQKLKQQAENKEYERMTRGLGGGQQQMYREEQLMGDQLKEVNKYLLVVAQFVVTAVSGFVSGYIAPYYLAGLEDVGIRLICGVLVFFIVAVADLYFVIRFFLAVDGVISSDNKKKAKEKRN